MTDGTDFDQYAQDYDALLDKGLSITGEDINYFARGRVAWLARCLKRNLAQPKSVMDFGCGTGTAFPHILELLRVESILGIDVSPKSLEVARQTYGSERVQLRLLDQSTDGEPVDLVFCNGVFHHLPRGTHAVMVNYIYRSLRQGGLFALWENNPWNPGTRYTMSRCPLDKDAITLAPPEVRHLLRTEGFEVLKTDFLFIFPRALRRLRWIEPLLARFPIGGQYQVLARRP